MPKTLKMPINIQIHSSKQKRRPYKRCRFFNIEGAALAAPAIFLKYHIISHFHDVGGRSADFFRIFTIGGGGETTQKTN